MKITVNGKLETVAPDITINDFLILKHLDPEKVVVEHNLNIVARENLGDVILTENDSLEVLRFVGGG
jgi:sulfur carrier protein